MAPTQTDHETPGIPARHRFQGIAMPGDFNPSGANFDKWLDNFYRECGREVTLAYTTLNQMLNWAIAMVAASIAAAVAFTSGNTAGSAPSQPFSISVPVFIIAVIGYVFNLRFFIRAILCYINLIRWNTLQSAIVSYMLLPQNTGTHRNVLTRTQRRNELVQHIQHYYYDWLSPLDRPSQLFQNLKLGFYLILALPFIFVVMGTLTLWSEPVVRGLTFFALGSTLVEFNDFAASRFFDTIQVSNRRKAANQPSMFPIPLARKSYFLFWILNLLISLGIVYSANVEQALAQTMTLLVKFTH
jgi:hypothetical protein